MSEWYLGLDLGQAADYSALAIAEVLEEPTGELRLERDRDTIVRTADGGAATLARPVSVTARVYQLRHLHRYPLQSPYPEIVADVCRILEREPLASADPVLALDLTGVGRPVYDIFVQARPRCRLVPITITGGHDLIRDGQGWHVPKRDLVSCAQSLLQTRRLRVAPSLKDAAVLVKELRAFRVKIAANGHDSYAAWRESDHDDLLLAVCLAAWTSEHGRPRPPLDLY